MIIKLPRRYFDLLSESCFAQMMEEYENIEFEQLVEERVVAVRDKKSNKIYKTVFRDAVLSSNEEIALVESDESFLDKGDENDVRYIQDPKLFIKSKPEKIPNKLKKYMKSAVKPEPPEKEES